MKAHALKQNSWANFICANKRRFFSLPTASCSTSTSHASVASNTAPATPHTSAPARRCRCIITCSSRSRNRGAKCSGSPYAPAPVPRLARPCEAVELNGGHVVVIGDGDGGGDLRRGVDGIAPWGT